MPTAPAFCAGSYLVPKRNGGFRHIINLRPLNKFLAIPRMKYESLSVLKYLVGQYSHSVAFDLESGYYMIGIHPSC